MTIKIHHHLAEGDRFDLPGVMPGTMIQVGHIEYEYTPAADGEPAYETLSFTGRQLTRMGQPKANGTAWHRAVPGLDDLRFYTRRLRARAQLEADRALTELGALITNEAELTR